MFSSADSEKKKKKKRLSEDSVDGSVRLHEKVSITGHETAGINRVTKQ